MTVEPPASGLDRHFARLMVRLEGKPNRELELAALFVSRHQTDGNICLPLEEVSGQLLSDSPLQFDRAPKRAQWVQKLRASSVVGYPGEFKPLILDQHDRLYLRRYWEYETSLAHAIKARVTAPSPDFDGELLEEG